MLKYYILTTFCLFSISSIFALEPSLKRPAFEHFYDVNKEWKHHAAATPNVNLAFDNDIERISAHLYYVEKELRKNTPKGLSRKALQNRIALLDTLKNYAFAAQFPQNIGHSTRRPYFIDHRGVHCAVGYLMTASGHAYLSKQIQKEHNFDYLGDIKTSGVTEWAAEHGFQPEELAWIQPSYLPSNNYAPLLNGTDGPVFAMDEQLMGNGKMVFIGDFTSADNQPCSNIGYYQNGSINCLGGGLIGNLSSLYCDYYGVNVAGSIENAGNVYPAAHYDSVWTYFDIPGRSGAIGTVIGEGFYSNHKLELAISHSSIPDAQEIWYLLSNGNWEKQATVYGVVFDIGNFYESSSSQYLFFYGGAFDSVKVHRNSLPDSTVFAKNLIARSAYNNDWISFGNEICDTVRSIKTLGNAIYFGGTGERNGFAVSRFANGNLDGLISSNHFQDSLITVNDLDAYQDQLLISGNFQIAAMIGFFGNNLAKYNLLDNSLEPLGLFNKAIESAVVMNNELYIGGQFDSCYYSQPLHHLAKMGFVSSNELAEALPIDIQVYPNPSNGQIHVDLGSKKSDVYTIITDINGRALKQADFSETQVIDLDISEFATGLYFLNIKSDSQNPISKKIIKPN